MLKYKQIWHGIKPTRWLIKFNLTPITLEETLKRGHKVVVCDPSFNERPSLQLQFYLHLKVGKLQKFIKDENALLIPIFWAYSHFSP